MLQREGAEIPAPFSSQEICLMLSAFLTFQLDSKWKLEGEKKKLGFFNPICIQVEDTI